LVFHLPNIFDVVESGLVGKGNNERGIGYAGDVGDV
jgi:hypothetical protein